MSDSLEHVSISSNFDPAANLILYEGDCLSLLANVPDGLAKLIVTSPPYNLGKEYETRLDLDCYLLQQRKVIAECVRTLNERGSLCWQVGNYVDNGEIIPLDILLYPVFVDLGLRLRNRIVWHFEHGLHASEKTPHPCQFPVELIERLVLALTEDGDWVLDPFMGVGTTVIAALMHGRRALGAEIVPEYVQIAKNRVRQAEEGKLRVRPMDRPIYDPAAPDLSRPPRLVRFGAESQPLGMILLTSLDS